MKISIFETSQIKHSQEFSLYPVSDGRYHIQSEIYPDRIDGDYDWSLLTCQVSASGTHIASVTMPGSQGQFYSAHVYLTVPKYMTKSTL